MKFKIRVRWTLSGRTQVEVYTRQIAPEQVEEYAVQLCDDYNWTVGESEPKKELVGLEILEEGDHPKFHNWEFQKEGKDIAGPYDLYKCLDCGITGRRREENGPIIRDKKFRVPEYEYCTPIEIHT